MQVYLFIFTDLNSQKNLQAHLKKIFFCPIVPNAWGTNGLSIGHYRTRKKKN